MEENKKKYIQVRLGGREYYFDISGLEEVVAFGEIVALPDAPSYVAGVMRFRTEVIPVFDIKNIIGVQDNVINKREKILVLKYKEEKVGVIIDRLIGIKDSEEGSKSVEEEHIIKLGSLIG